MSLPSSSLVAVAALGMLACYTDLRWRRVPNALTVGAILSAAAFHLAVGGGGGLVTAVSGCLLGLLLFLPLFALGGMGAGDVKLLAAFGAWLGPSGAAWTALYASLAGGVLAIAVGLSHGYLRKAFANLWGLAAFWRVAGLRQHPELRLDAAGGPRLPYAVAISIGAMVTLWRG